MSAESPCLTKDMVSGANVTVKAPCPSASAAPPSVNTTNTTKIISDETSKFDCVGEWLPCNSSCVKTYAITTKRGKNGKECAEQAGAVAACMSGEGQCAKGDPPFAMKST